MWLLEDGGDLFVGDVGSYNTQNYLTFTAVWESSKVIVRFHYGDEGRYIGQELVLNGSGFVDGEGKYNSEFILPANTEFYRKGYMNVGYSLQSTNNVTAEHQGGEAYLIRKKGNEVQDFYIVWKEAKAYIKDRITIGDVVVEQYFATFADAMANANKDDIIYLIANVDILETLHVNLSVTILAEEGLEITISRGETFAASEGRTALIKVGYDATLTFGSDAGSGDLIIVGTTKTTNVGGFVDA